MQLKYGCGSRVNSGGVAKVLWQQGQHSRRHMLLKYSSCHKYYIYVVMMTTNIRH